MNDSVAINDLPESAGTHLTAEATGNAFQEGWYYNTTRIEEKQSYLYMWRHACAFTKWIPSNQFLHANEVFNPDSMTLERFGLIGVDKRCYWGCIGVLWKRPLPLWEILPNETQPVVAPVAPPAQPNETRSAPPAEEPPFEYEGLVENRCYRLKAYEHEADYLKVMNGNEVYSSPTEGSQTIFRVVKPLMEGGENTISLETWELNGKYVYVENDLGFADSPNGDNFNERATFVVQSGKIGGQGLNFRAVGDTERLLVHEPYEADVPSHRLTLETFEGAFSQRKSSTFKFEDIDCNAQIAETHENDFFEPEY